MDNGLTSAAGADAPAGGEVQKRLREMEILLQVSRELAGLKGLNATLGAFVRLISLALNAERSTLFLNDETTSELYSRVAQGDFHHEIRFANDLGIAGMVFGRGIGAIVPDAYADPRFNRLIDEQTGYVTRNILCVPIRTVDNDVVGVVQSLNKKDGQFSESDLKLLEAMSTQAAVALMNAQHLERMEETHRQALDFLDAVTGVTTDIDLHSLVNQVMASATRMLHAENAALFMHDGETETLWCETGTTAGKNRISVGVDHGIPGEVFRTGKTIRLVHPYADLRFDPHLDEKLGVFSRSILCVPVFDRDGKPIGAAQMANKRGGRFTEEDETWLAAFTNQVAIGLDNARLFSDVQNMKNYADSMLQSMSNGVVTLDQKDRAVTINMAARRILRVREHDIIGEHSEDFFSGPNAWIHEKIDLVNQTGEAESVAEATMRTYYSKTDVLVNMTVLPLVRGEKERERLGTMLVFEDITNEKRLKSTMSRYMDPLLADRLLAEEAEILGGNAVTATVLFSDIREFTKMTEELGAQGTVSLLNEYFTEMVDCVQREGGMLDKFIGDALMAGFGVPLARGEDEDRAVRAGITMLKRLAVWNKTRIDEGRKPLSIGVGINTDMVITGNIGSPRRMDYTLIGEGVNMASRIESATKRYGAPILVSEHTLHRLKGTYLTREIDQIIAKGTSRPVGLYEILDHYSEADFPQITLVLKKFAEGLNLYRRRDFEKAKAAFMAALALHPGDRVSQTYVERCDVLIQTPPGPEWDSVWRMTEK
ncbi:MAG: GAF domain-containing protein [Magnetospiraceae bacterium]